MCVVSAPCALCEKCVARFLAQFVGVWATSRLCGTPPPSYIVLHIGDSDMRRLLLLLLLPLFTTMAQTRVDGAVEGDARPWTRWWWYADSIHAADTRAQLQWLRDQGFGGVEVAFVYPPGGDTSHARLPWLGAAWSAAVATAARQCDSLGLGFDATFGTLWPFGDSTVPPEDASMQFGDSVASARMRLTWEHPRRGRVLNHLDREAFGRYARRMGDALEAALRERQRGLFCDSWEVETRRLWTRGFERRFLERYGYDIVPMMDSVYRPGFADVHYDYMALLSDMVLDEFYRPFTAFAHARGARTRAQCGGAPVDLIEAFRAVDIPESEALLFAPAFSRIASSAATLNGARLVSAESFTCMYGWKGWPGPGPMQGRERIEDARLVADALFAQGVNMLYWHGMPYNPPGRDSMFYASVHVSPMSAWAPRLAGFNSYIETVQRHLRRGRNYTDVAVYLPTEDAWMGVELPDSLKLPWAWGQYEMRYNRVPETLAGRQPLWVNSAALEQGSVRDGVLRLGDAVFRSLLVDANWLDARALRALLRVARQGLVVCMLREPRQPGRARDAAWSELLRQLLAEAAVTHSIEQLPGSELIEGDGLPPFWCRVDGDELVLFFAHPATVDVAYPLRHGQGLESGEEVRDVLLRWNGHELATRLRFLAGQSLLLRLSADGRLRHIPLPTP